MATHKDTQPTASILYAAEKLLPYEIRYFHDALLAKSLGYMVIAKYQQVPLHAPSQEGNHE